MEKNYSSDDSIRGTIKDMKIGDIIHFPVCRLSVVRSTACTLSVELDRKYSSRRNKKLRTVDLIRNL